MAGDWIPMRIDLADDPAVIAIAAATGLSEDAVVGKLHRLWGWANKHLEDGYARNVTDSWIDRHTGTTGFAAAMLAAGWLRTRSGGVEFPSFDRWNSKGAKNRVLSAQRMRKKRDAESDAGGVTKPSPKKRRGEKSKGDTPPLPPAAGGANTPAKPPPFDPLAVELPHRSPAFAAAWADWAKHRREKKQPLTETSVAKQLGQIGKLTEANAIACIEKSVASGWTGLFPDDFASVSGPNPRSPPRPKSAADREEDDYHRYLGGIEE